jgi:hypothetical protein
MSMADNTITQHKPAQDELYLKLLKGEITSAEFVNDLKAEARSNRSLATAPGAEAARERR